MSRAQQRGAALRQQLGLRGQVDAEAVANDLGLTIKRWSLRVLEEMRLENYVAVADRLEPEWRRWVLAHAIGHCLLHAGNYLCLRWHTDLTRSFEREAEDFACGLLVDVEEAAAEGLATSWEVAEHFGVPDEMVRLRAPSTSANTAALRPAARTGCLGPSDA